MRWKTKWILGWVVYLLVVVSICAGIWRLVERTNRRIEAMGKKLTEFERQFSELEQMLEADDKTAVARRIGLITNPCLRKVSIYWMERANPQTGEVPPETIKEIQKMLEDCNNAN